MADAEFPFARPVIPATYRVVALREVHDRAGHFGVDKTFRLLSERVWMPHMRKHVQQYVACCDVC